MRIATTMAFLACMAMALASGCSSPAPATETLIAFSSDVQGNLLECG